MTSESPGVRRKRQRAANRFARALEAHQSGDLPLAERRYLKVLELDPRNISALPKLGNLYQNFMNKPSKALALY